MPQNLRRRIRTLQREETVTAIGPSEWVRTQTVGRLFYSPMLVEDMSEAALDDRGRLTLPKELRERYGDRYYIVQLHDGIKLVPIEDDPLDALRSEFADVDKTAAELRQDGRRAALDEAGR